MARLVCDVCGGMLVVQSDGDTAICESCGLAYKMDALKKSSFKGTTVDSEKAFGNYFELAVNALSCDDFSEAIKYADKALELNVSDSDMWLVKGEALLKDGAYIKDNINKAIQCFKQAASNADLSYRKTIEDDSNKIICQAIKLYQKSYVEYLDNKFSRSSTAYFIDSFETIMIAYNKYLEYLGIDVIENRYHKEALKGQVDAYRRILCNYMDSICSNLVTYEITMVDLDRFDDDDFNTCLALADDLITASYSVEHLARDFDEIKEGIKNFTIPLVVDESDEVKAYSLEFRKWVLSNLGAVMYFTDDRGVEISLKEEYKRAIGPLP